MPLRFSPFVGIVFSLILSVNVAFAQDDSTAPIQMDTLEVVAVTPTGGTGIPISQIPTNVQSISSHALQRYRPLDVTDGLGTRLGSVHLSNLGSNSFQPDMNYRGLADRRC